MQLIAPDILAEARGMTGAMAGTVCVLGIALWLFGWRWHRFWVVAGITLAAGLIGLNVARPAGVQVMAVGILLAVAAGMMALELAKLVAFVAGGVGAWLAVQWVLPQAQELWAVFLSGGLLGLLLYRIWTMLLTSLMGTLLAGHAGLLLIEPVSGLDAVGWAGSHIAALNGVVVGLVILGILLQTAAMPDEDGKPGEEKQDDKHHHDKHHHEEPEHAAHDAHAEEPHGAKPAPWWKRPLHLPKLR
ncbi:MAG: hypothetical protein JWO38_7325 [Gemmataceae bacterium]|nr:hypothetical protein [Gemmataceae bacterium]